MNIKVIGAGCSECARLYKNTLTALEETGCSADVEKVEDLVEIVRLGVKTSPSLMIDGKLVVSGRAATKKQIIKILNELI